MTASELEQRELGGILAELETITDRTFPLTTNIDPQIPTHTRIGVIEVFPDTVTPAMWSSTGEGMSRIATRIARDMRLISKRAVVPSQGLFYGMVAVNVDSYLAFNRRLPGAPWWPWSRAAKAMPQTDADAISGWRAPAGVGQWIVDTFWRIRGYQACRRLEAELLDDLAPRAAELARLEAETEQRDFSALSSSQLADELGKRGNNAALVRLHMGVTFLIGSYFIALRYAIARYTSMPVSTTAAGLLVSLGDIESTKAAQALRNVAIEIRVAPRLAALLAARDFAGFARALEDPRDAAEQKVAKARKDFLRDYGYRGIGEAALDAKAWGEAPEQADALLALYVVDPTGERNSGAATRQALEAEVLNSIADPRARRVMERRIALAQKFASLREYTKSLTVRQSRRARRINSAFLDKLVAEGVLDSPGDRDMLTIRELLRAAATDRVEVRALIARRRRAYVLLQKLDIEEITFSSLPTPRMKAHYRAAEEAARAPLAVGGTLQGLGVSPGQVEGIARIVLDPRQAADIKPGEILIAPFTDAAWSPLFLLSVGVVIDTGMTISHGATLARELGLPAVVNVPGTAALHSGDRIRLDATAGVVTLLERSTPPRAAAAPAAGAQTMTPVNVSLDDVALLSTLRAVRLKGRASTEGLRAHLACGEAELTSRLAAASSLGCAEFTGRHYRLTPAGTQWLETALVHQRPNKAEAEAVYNDFLPLNEAFKQMTYDWQMFDATSPNDHSRPAYDASVLARIETVHGDIRRLLPRAAALASRLLPVEQRLENAIAQVRRGDTQFLMSPKVDSYHSVWFELHEELIDLTGRSRSAEAAAGRAA